MSKGCNSLFEGRLTQSCMFLVHDTYFLYYLNVVFYDHRRKKIHWKSTEGLVLTFALLYPLMCRNADGKCKPKWTFGSAWQSVEGLDISTFGHSKKPGEAVSKRLWCSFWIWKIKEWQEEDGKTWPWTSGVTPRRAPQLLLLWNVILSPKKEGREWMGEGAAVCRAQVLFIDPRVYF